MIQPFKIVKLTDATLVEFGNAFAKSLTLAVDTETYGDRPCIGIEKFPGLRWALGDRPFMATFAADTDTAFFSYDQALVQEALAFAADHNARFVFHNAKFDLHMLREWVGFPVPENASLDDTMLMHSVLFPGER